jgi:8-oxo-dGTP pyrophosphatase MutT (NUDIX family)
MTDTRTARPASRILLVDGTGRALLFRFEPGDRPPFWCTPGGALDPGESYRQAARRELFEETGIDADPGGEVARRQIEFITLEGVPVVADERYFLVRVDEAVIDTAGHTALEQRVMTRWRWFTRAEIAAHPERIYPEDLIELLQAVAGVLA